MAFFLPESILKGGLRSSLLQAVAQSLAFAYSIVMAYCFGAIAATDVLNYCIGAFTIITTFLLSLDSAVLIPEAIRRRETRGDQAAQDFLNFFLFLYVAIILAATILAILHPVGFLRAVSKFDPAILAAHRSLIMWVLPVFLLTLLAQYLGSILNAYRFFSLSSFWAAFNRVINISFVLLLHRQLGVIALAQALIVGTSIQILVQLWLLRHHLRWHFRFRVPVLEPKTIRDILYTVIGLVVVAMAVFSPTVMGSGSTSGFVTAMNYDTRMSMVPEQLLTTQIVVIMGIRFNELLAHDDTAAFADLYERSIRFMFWICSPLTALLVLVAPEVLRILFLHGAFSEEALSTTITLFQGLILCLPIIIYNGWLLQAYSAHQRLLARNLMDICMNVGIFAALWLLVPRIGLLRYPLVKAACFYGIHFLWMLVARRSMSRIPLAKIYAVMLLDMLICALLAFPCFLLLSALRAQAIHPILRILAGLSAYAASWLLLNIIWRWDTSATSTAMTLLRRFLHRFQNSTTRSTAS